MKASFHNERRGAFPDSAALLVFIALFGVSSCDDDLTPKASLHSYALSNSAMPDAAVEDEYPGGEYAFLNANPLSDGFRKLTLVRDFAGKYTFWFIGCPS